MCCSAVVVRPDTFSLQYISTHCSFRGKMCPCTCGSPFLRRVSQTNTTITYIAWHPSRCNNSYLLFMFLLYVLLSSRCSAGHIFPSIYKHPLLVQRENVSVHVWVSVPETRLTN